VVEGLSTIYEEFRRGDVVELDVDDDEAIEVARRLIRQGFPVGPSSGLNYLAAAQVAARLRPDAKVVTVFPDRMERYFSTELFARC
jgi:cysteine synthase A